MEPALNTRAVIASRLRSWMGARPDLDTQVKVARSAGVSQTTMSRVLNAQTGVTIDNLEAIAAAFGRDVWQLVAPDALALLSGGHSLATLPDSEQARIAAFVKFTIEQHSLCTAGKVLNIDTVINLPREQREAVRRAAVRPRRTGVQEGAVETGKGRRPTVRRRP